MITVGAQEEPGEPQAADLPRGKSWKFPVELGNNNVQRCPLVAILLNSQHFYFRSDGYLKIVYLTTVHTNISSNINMINAVQLETHKRTSLLCNVNNARNQSQAVCA